MKRDGLERHRWIDPIEDFIRQYGRATPRWAVFLTYNIDLNRFSRAVLPLLARRGRCFRTVLLSDQADLEARLTVSAQLPGSVNVHPVRCKRGGVFHPKLVFLRAGRHVRVCFGSANITDGGMGTNLEIWTSSDSPEIVGGIQHFLLALTQSPDLAIDQGACRSLKRALSGLIGSETDSVWSSLQESFASRLKKGTERNSRQVTIISPMYAGKVGVKMARAAIPCRAVDLYTNMNVSVPKSTVRVYSPPDVADSEEEYSDPAPCSLHAKAYVFSPSSNNTSVAWIGSANFSEQALTKSLSKRGNVELMIRTQLPKDEVDAFKSDLKKMFKKDESTPKAPPKPPPLAKPASTILSCELAGTTTMPRLIIYSIQQRGHVLLVREKHASHRIRVEIKRGRGVLEGKMLRKLLPGLELSAACSLVIYEFVRGRTVPVVVNVPHVPTNNGGEEAGYTSIDALLDDLLGRIRIPDKTQACDNEFEEGAGFLESDDYAEGDSEMNELERRLDEAHHQGEIDQLAVKAALLKKLAFRTTAAGPERDGMLCDVLRALLAASPRHLATTIRSLFGDVEPAKSA